MGQLVNNFNFRFTLTAFTKMQAITKKAGNSQDTARKKPKKDAREALAGGVERKL